MARVVDRRCDLLPVSYALTVAAGRTLAVAAELPFHPLTVALSVLTMPTLWAIKHNAIHRPVFLDRRVDRGFLALLGVLTGTASTWTKIVHCEIHHRYNNGPDDWTSIEQAPGFRWRPLRFAAYPFVVARRLLAERRRHLADKPALRRRVLAETLLTAGVTAVAVVIAPWATLWYVAVPIVFGQWFLIAMNYLQHAGGTVGDPFEHTVNDTGRVFNRLLLNLGFHAAHHRDPSRHWSELPGLHDREVAHRVHDRFLQPNFGRRLIGEAFDRPDR